MKTALLILLSLALSSSLSAASSANVLLKANELSPEYRAMLSRQGLHNIQLKFVSEDELAIGYFDDSDSSMVAVQEQRPRRNFHLLIDLFSISTSSRVAHLKLNTPTIHSTITAFNRSLLIAHGNKITVLDSSGQIKQEANAGALCLKEPDTEGPVEAEVLEAGLNHAVLMHRTERLDSAELTKPLRARVTRSTTSYCWFSTSDLKPVSMLQANAFGGLSSMSASGEKVLISLGSYSREITPQGVRGATFPCEAKDKNFSAGYLLPLEGYRLLRCRSDQITIEHNNSLLKLKTPEKPGWFAAAGKAAILATYSSHGRLEKNGSAMTGELEVFDYSSGKRLLKASDAFSQTELIYEGALTQIAISPSGKSVALLHAGSIYIYLVPVQ